MGLSAQQKQLFNALINSGNVRKITHPGLAASITLTGGKSWAYGIWVEIVALAAVTADFWLSTVYATTINTATGDEYQIQIGSGTVAAGAISGGAGALATFLVGDEIKSDVGHYLHVECPIGHYPILIPSGTGIGGRVANAAAGAANTIAVKVGGYTAVGS